jgi:hypothetical protein
MEEGADNDLRFGLRRISANRNDFIRTVSKMLLAVALLTIAAVAFPPSSRANPQNTKAPSSEGPQAVMPPGRPVIEVQAPSVVVGAIVTDKKGRPVPGFTAADFAVYENKNQ